MKALIVNDTEEQLPESFIHDWLDRALGLMSQMQVVVPEKLKPEMSLVFLKETEAKRLNWTYRGKDYATDILSFENDDPESFGELVFCWAVVQKNAKEHKLTLENELGYLLIHGVMHLLGFDHEKPGSDGEKMLKIQDELFEKLKFKPKVKKEKVAVLKTTSAKNVVPKKAALNKAKMKTPLKVVAKKAPAAVAAKGKTKAKVVAKKATKPVAKKSKK